MEPLNRDVKMAKVSDSPRALDMLNAKGMSLALPRAHGLLMMLSMLKVFKDHQPLSGPLRLRVQSQSRAWLRIAASIAFWFRACFKGFISHSSTTIARLSPLSSLDRGS